MPGIVQHIERDPEHFSFDVEEAAVPIEALPEIRFQIKYFIFPPTSAFATEIDPHGERKEMQTGVTRSNSSCVTCIGAVLLHRYIF